MKKIIERIKNKQKILVFSIFGKVTAPAALSAYDTGSPQGLFTFVNNIIKILIMGAGLFTLFNLILAGYGFISAGGKSESIEAAWAKIWQSLLGLVIVAGSIVIAGVAGLVIYGDSNALLTPRLYGP